MYRDWLLWQLVDSAFPTGGFAHSAGLEAAKQAGQIDGEDDLIAFLHVSLDQAAQTALPYVVDVFDDASRFAQADQHCDAFLANPITNRASRAQGNGLLAAAASAFPEAPFRRWRKEARTASYCYHLAPTWGRILEVMELRRRDVERAFMFVTARTVLSAAIRLNVIGPLRAQALQHELAAAAEDRLDRHRPGNFRDVVQTAPLLDAWQSSHDRLYSRLFHS